MIDEPRGARANVGGLATNPAIKCVHMTKLSAHQSQEFRPWKKARIGTREEIDAFARGG